ncbi:hypothetical protein RDV89_05585 [Nocardioides zeae]|uniref:DUF1906 domain-containing protein n=1 Tax=Nocardioides imazamoxiresistens TaxID=3231893 RepID=A0ABU3PTL2_9ACTN|nr:hypothetical protein [Nocardioides zeae]MDT9592529.1 hypothetical protein [Nocardioides zeae]
MPVRGRARRRVAAVPALLVVGLLTACSGEPRSEDAGDAGGASSSTSTPSASPSTTSAGPTTGPSPGADAADLAGRAEDLAGEQATRGADEVVPGGDISWPQCPRGLGIPEKRTLGMPMPLEEAEYVVVGLTNGPGFHVNPCLADQVAWVAERRLLGGAYAVASYPDDAELAAHRDAGPFDGDDPAGALRNTGWAQAQFNVASMRAAGLPAPAVWIDVEPVPDFDWSDDTAANAAVVEGLARGYADAGLDIGVYSTPYLWEQIVGDLELGVGEWRAAGHTSRDEALSRCGSDWVIQGGPAVLGQWVADDRDQNVTCPGVAPDLGRWFHQF